MSGPQETPVYEYSLDQSKYYFDDKSDDDMAVVGILKKPISYSLNQLLKSNIPKHKEILKSLVINTAEKDLSSGFKCLLNKNYPIIPLNKQNQTVLHLAYYHKSTGILEELEDYLESETCQNPEKTLCEYTDINGLTHLHVVCALGTINIVDRFSKNSVNINSRFVISTEPYKEYSGWTALHFVMGNFEYCSKEMVDLLAERGADVNALDDKGRTPMHVILSVTKGRNHEITLQVLEALIARQADVNIKDANGNTPLHIIFLGWDDAWMFLCNPEYLYPKFFEEVEMNVKLLLRTGADVNVKNNNNDTVALLTVNCLKILRDKFVYPNFELYDSNLVQLLELMMKSNEEMDLNMKNNNGDTPLSLAISNLSIDMVEFLLEHTVFTGLNADYKTNGFFTYPYNVLSFESLQKLITILKLLFDEDCELKSKDCLTILKFLVCNRRNTDLLRCNFRSHVFHMLCLESSEHLGGILKSFYSDFERKARSYCDRDDNYLSDFDKLNGYLVCINLVGIFIDEKAKTLIKNTLDQCIRLLRNDSDLKVDTEGIDEDLDCLKSIKLPNGDLLINALKRNPKETARYFGNEGIDENSFKNSYYFKGIIKGHLTMSVIRYYVVTLAYNCTTKLHCTPLPHICYELIADYLSNKDILNLCLALDT